MHILIDKARMMLLRKHRSVDVLANLAWIESHDAFVAILPLEQAKILSQFTEMELRTLYANTTGGEFRANKYPALLQVLYDIILRAPEDVVDAGEVEEQANYIKENASYKYSYVYGANKPAREPDLFTPDAVLVSRDKNAELMALKGGYGIEEEIIESQIIQTGKVETVNLDKQKSKPSKKPVRKSEQPGTESKKEMIWRVCKELWIEKGSIDTTSDEFAAFKKNVISVLVNEYDVNKSTANGNFTRWVKENFN